MLTIRPASQTDLPNLTGMARRSWLSGFTDAPPRFVSDWVARDFEPGWYARYWPDMSVAEDGVPLGVVQPMGDEVNGLWVDPPAQGRGVGTLLLRHAEGLIAVAGYERSWLTCSGFNPQGCRFYLARGYREIGRRPTERAGGVVEEVRTYELQLSRFAGDGSGAANPGTTR